MVHQHPWNPISEQMVGYEVSVLIWTGEKHDIILGSKQILGNRVESTPSTAIALHCWKVVSVCDEVVILEQGSDSVTVPLPPSGSLDFCQVSEVCAGLGGTMSGAVQVGFRPIVGLDQSSLSCGLLRLNGVPIVLQGDLQHLRTLARFHLAHLTSRCGLLAGFPCQPFSTLDLAMAFRDPRSRTFFCILDLAWLTQASFLLLECVVVAGNHSIVRETLDAFCKARGFQMVCIVLHLHNTIPCRRTRWWCLMFPTWLPALEIPDLPVCLTRQVLRDVFPFWPVWPEEEEMELKLDSQELAAFQSAELGNGLEGHLLDMTGQCPTLLHSMGNVLSFYTSQRPIRQARDLARAWP